MLDWGVKCMNGGWISGTLRRSFSSSFFLDTGSFSDLHGNIQCSTGGLTKHLWGYKENVMGNTRIGSATIEKQELFSSEFLCHPAAWLRNSTIGVNVHGFAAKTKYVCLQGAEGRP